MTILVMTHHVCHSFDGFHVCICRNVKKLPEYLCVICIQTYAVNKRHSRHKYFPWRLRCITLRETANWQPINRLVAQIGHISETLDNAPTVWIHWIRIAKQNASDGNRHPSSLRGFPAKWLSTADKMSSIRSIQKSQFQTCGSFRTN